MITKIIIEIKGGVVQAVYANQPIQYVLVDHDNIQEGDNIPLPGDGHLNDPDGIFEDLDIQINQLLK